MYFLMAIEVCDVQESISAAARGGSGRRLDGELSLAGILLRLLMPMNSPQILQITQMTGQARKWVRLQSDCNTTGT